MLELLLCSLFTLVPDYLYRRYAQGRRIGKEITLYSVWFELRWGITGCVILTVALITTVFYNHPSTTNVTLFFRTVPIIFEAVGRVAEIYVDFSAPVAQGAPIFKLDSSKQDAAVRVRSAQDLRGRCRDGCGANRRHKGREPDSGGQELLSASGGRTGNQARVAKAQSGQCRVPRYREATACCRGPSGHGRGGYGGKAGNSGTALQPAAIPKSQR